MLPMIRKKTGIRIGLARSRKYPARSQIHPEDMKMPLKTAYGYESAVFRGILYKKENKEAKV